MYCGRSKKLLVNVLILLVITLSTTTVRCQQESTNAAQQTEQAADGAVAAGSDDVKDYLASGLRLEHELVKEQADEPSARQNDENFVAIHVDAVGAKEQLNPALRGLSYLAVSFLPKEYSFLEVLSATREVVAGVRYNLVVNTLNAEQHEVICELTVLEQPWITTESGDKYRRLESSNCSSAYPSGDRVEVVTKLNPIFDPSIRERQTMSPSRFQDLVKQIIVQKQAPVDGTETSLQPEITISSTEAPTGGGELSESAMGTLDQLFMFGSEAQTPRRTTTEAANHQPEVIEETIVPHRRVAQSQVDVPSTGYSHPETTPMSLDQQVQSTFEEVLKTHHEIQKALDEVIQRGGGRDIQQKYEPVFASLLQKVKTSIDNYYRTLHPNGGGEANFDTAAFVVRDSTATSPATPPVSNNQSSESEEDLQQHQQIIQPDFSLLPIGRVENSAQESTPPRIESVVMHFSGDDNDDQRHQQQHQDDIQRPQTREELLKDFNVDDSQHQERTQRVARSASHEHDRYQSLATKWQRRSTESNAYRPQSFYSFPNSPFPFYYPRERRKRSLEQDLNDDSHQQSHRSSYRQKRAVELNLNDIDPQQMDRMEKTIEEAIDMLDQMDPDAFKRILLEIINVKRIDQFSSAVEQKGELFVARVLIANSHCIEDAEDVAKCKRLLIDGSGKFCTLEMRVKKDGGVRLVKSECAVNAAPGGPQEVDVSSPEHYERVQAGLKSSSGQQVKYDNFAIRCGTVQVVAGTVHRYTVDFLDGNQQHTSTCKIKVYTPLGADSRPEYTFECEDTGSGRYRRDVDELSEEPKLGGLLELTPEEYSNPEHTERIQSILLTSGESDTNQRNYQVLSATRLLVAGILYTYKITFNDDPDKRVCTLTSHEQLWLLKKNPAEAKKYSFACETRKKRDLCTGCPSTFSPEELKEDEHLQRINKILVGTGGTTQRNLEVLNGTSQVVSGLKYTYYVAYHLQGVRRVCKLTAWEQPWKNPGAQYYTECDGKDRSNAIRRHKRGVRVGGARPLSASELANDEHVQRINKILVFGVGTSHEQPKVVKGTVQVVAGSLYTYEIGYPVNGEERTCTLTAWERPWLEDKAEAYKYTFKCDGVDEQTLKRARRHAKKVGGSNDLTSEDLKDKSHAERIRAGLVAYNTERSKSYQDFEILKGSVQLVAGSLYKYTFKVKDEPNVICKISVWERIWLDTQDQRKYNVKCDGDDEGSEQKDATVSKRQLRSIRPHLRQIEEHYSKGDIHARHLFEKFKLKHNRTYASTLEHEMRYRIFKNNLFKIEQLNKYEQGTAKYGITHFADMTSAEYRLRTGLVVPTGERNHIRNPVAQIDENIQLPESFDWRQLGAVTSVKNQGSCGSCWAFSVTGNIEGLHQIKTKKLEEYSEQELLDCDTVDSACNGGYMDDAYKAIEKLGGLELESEYPYQARKQKTCHFNKTLVHVRVQGAVDLPKNETAIAQYLVANGPVSIGLNANAMQFYRGGISHPWRPLCSKKSLDHGVLLVGYGVKEYPMFNKTLPYWIVKNSWGPKWGEQGYYRVFRGDNTCGVAEMATSAVLE